ncbi:MAG: DnaB-like helicase N-terminal domain-containing protein [Bacillota bacterium]
MKNEIDVSNPNHLGHNEQTWRELLEAESMIIGAILIEPTLIEKLTLEERHFSQIRNRIVFKAMKELQKKRLEINLVMLMEELGDQIEKIGGVHFLLEIANYCPSTSNIEQYEQIVLKYYELDLIRNSANHFLSDYTPESAQELYKALIDMHTQIS